jgi:hypothetical protein
VAQGEGPEFKTQYCKKKKKFVFDKPLIRLTNLKRDHYKLPKSAIEWDFFFFFTYRQNYSKLCMWKCEGARS